MKHDRSARSPGPGLEEHLATWGLDGRVTRMLVLVPILFFALAVLASLSAPSAYIALTDEDGLVEWLQVAALVAAGVIFMLVASRGWRLGRRFEPVAQALIGIGALVVAGEEISWGQRIFGWATPQLFDSINYQGETNLHNTIALESVMKLTEIGLGAFGAFVPLVAVAHRAPQWIRSSLLVPPIALVSFFLITFLHWTSRIVIDPSRSIARLSEAAELALFTGGALFAWLCLRRLRRASVQVLRSAPLPDMADLRRGRA